MDDRIKLLITYDIVEDNQQVYYQYVIGEFVPAAQQLGLTLADAWHTLYGDYPIRLLVFVGHDRRAVQLIVRGDEWQRLEDKLLTFVTDYQRRIVPYQERFQY